MRETLGRLHYNLGAAPVDAKGTTRDYLPHSSEIPAQIMALEWVISEVVKACGALPRRTGNSIGMPHWDRRRRGGAGSMRIRPSIRLTNAPARVCFSLIGARLTPRAVVFVTMA